MQALVGAVVLAWLALALLAFAMAGLLRQLRDVQAGLVRSRSGHGGGRPVPREIPASVRPHGDVNHAVVLLVDNDCPICTEVAPVFADLATVDAYGMDFIVLGRTPTEKFTSLPHCRYLVDVDAYHLLDPGWRPAILVVDGDGKVVLAEPAGSVESVRAVVGDLARLASQSNPSTVVRSSERVR